MTKRQRTDTATGAVNAMLDALPVAAPEHIADQLTPTGRVHWGIITRSKAASMWSENDLELAGELAITRQDKSKLRVLLVETEADDNENPMHKLNALVNGDKQIDILVKREERLTRLLQIHAEATTGKARDQVKKNTAAREAVGTMEKASSLIARPVH